MHEPNEVVFLRYHNWETFFDEVIQACASLDFTGVVPITDDASEDFVVRSELGLAGRITKNICDSASKAL